MAGDESFPAPKEEGEEIQIISDSMSSQENANSIERALGSIVGIS